MTPADQSPHQLQDFQQQIMQRPDSTSATNTPTPVLAQGLPVTKPEANMTAHYDPSIPATLPHERMYNLQIGNKRFVLSGASLSSDSPSYFTNYFSNSANANKTLFIDRSPDVFRLIYDHLQGYFVEIADADIFTKLFNDALYYNLPKLRDVLKNNEYYYVFVSGQSIKFAKNLVAGPGNFPNFFTVANDALYEDLTSLIVEKKWIRPPPQAAPSLNRDADLLRELISLFQGVEVEIRSDSHRRSLIREARYYRFNTLVERLIKSKVIYNPFENREEIIVASEYLDSKSLTLGNDGYLGFKRLYTDVQERPLQIQFEAGDFVIYKEADLIHFKFVSLARDRWALLLKGLVRRVFKSSEIAAVISNVRITDDVFVISIPLSEFDTSNSSIKVTNNGSQVIGSEDTEVMNWTVLQALVKVKFIAVNQGSYAFKPEITKAKVVVNPRDFYDELEFL